MPTMLKNSITPLYANRIIYGTLNKYQQQGAVRRLLSRLFLYLKSSTHERKATQLLYKFVGEKTTDVNKHKAFLALRDMFTDKSLFKVEPKGDNKFLLMISPKGQNPLITEVSAELMSNEKRNKNFTQALQKKLEKRVEQNIGKATNKNMGDTWLKTFFNDIFKFEYSVYKNKLPAHYTPDIPASKDKRLSAFKELVQSFGFDKEWFGEALQLTSSQDFEKIILGGSIVGESKAVVLPSTAKLVPYYQIMKEEGESGTVLRLRSRYSVEKQDFSDQAIQEQLYKDVDSILEENQKKEKPDEHKKKLKVEQMMLEGYIECDILVSDKKIICYDIKDNTTRIRPKKKELEKFLKNKTSESKPSGIPEEMLHHSSQKKQQIKNLSK